MTEHDAKVAGQMSRFRFIKRLETESRQASFKTLHPEAVRTQLEHLQSAWKMFDEQHNRLCELPLLDFHKLEYTNDGMYDECQDLYTKAITAHRILQAEQATQVPLNAPPATTQVLSRAIVPQVALPSFAGDFVAWRHFRDTFESLVHRNTQFSPLEKLLILKAALLGEAARRIESLPVEAASFDLAWQRLLERYENHRVLEAELLDGLLGDGTQAIRTASSLDDLVTSVREAFFALEALGTPTAQWGPIAARIIVRRMDGATRALWEMALGAQTTSPTLDQVQAFLHAQVRGLENQERGRAPQPRTSSGSAPRAHQPTPATLTQARPLPSYGAKSHAAVPGPSESPRPRLCELCGEEHFIVSCPEFRASTSRQRRQAVEHLRLCYNCLGNHNVVNCRNKKRCQHCGGLHHSMIHLEPAHPQGTPQPQTVTTTVYKAAPAAEPAPSEHEATRAPTPPPRPRTPSPAPLAIFSTDQGLQPHYLSTWHGISGRGTDTSTGHPQPGHPHTTLGTSHATPPASALTPPPSGILRPNVLLATCQATTLSIFGTTHQVRILIDPGSELTFVSERTARTLRLEVQPSNIRVSGVGGTHSGSTRGAIVVRLTSIYDRTAGLTITAHILKKTTTWLPSFAAPELWWPHLQGTPLADPDFLTPGEIDFILGADTYGQLLEPGVRKGAPQEPIALRTLLGWVVLGPVDDGRAGQAATTHSVAIDHQLHDLLERFWIQEESTIRTTASLTEDELACEQHFMATHTRDRSGRYVVRLPLKAPVTSLGDSRPAAQGALRRLLKRLSGDDHYKELYVSFVREYEELSHLRKLSQTSPEPSSVYYLPHHGVLKEQSLTTKLRVVFNGSAPTSSGRSLNDIVYTGANLQVDIADVILWVRKHRFLFATDITKMFRQIRVHSDDWDLQRILWTDEQGALTPCQLTTVTYGTRPAPFLAVRVLLQLVADDGHRYPLAIAPLTRGRYVDDIYGGSDDRRETQEIARQVTALCKAGGFSLAKWASNDTELLQAASPEAPASDLAHPLEDAGVKILGLSWHPQADDFRFHALPATSASVTKRAVLSEVAQLYDPLGFLALVIVRAKMLLQELWLDKLGWDDPLSPQTRQRWHQFRTDLIELRQFSIPRWLHLTRTTQVELHGFSDASQLAMAAVVYVRVSSMESEPITTLVSAKTRVAPLKPLTIPRLELGAAVLLAKLVKHIQETLELAGTPAFLWTDSTVALTWILSHPSRWKDFVRNRVVTAQDLVPHAQWRFVPGKDNPADCASRGLTPAQLSHHSLWWSGPPWLALPQQDWPSSLPRPDPKADLEERPGLTLASTASEPHPLWELIHRYSSLTRLLRITALCRRAVAKFRRTPDSSLNNPLTSEEMEAARIYWVRATQGAYFSAELKAMARGQHLSRTHPLTRLTAFVDRSGILRVGGRLRHAELEEGTKHPFILPRDSPLTRLLISDAHLRTLHGGTQLTLAHLRRTYWIIGGRAPVRSHILHCTRCARQRGVRAQQLMGQLPTSRVTPSRPFLNTGVDYAGPVTLKTWRGRGAKTHKGWLAIFVCFVTSAVHLEAVSDYSTEAFISAFRRFVGRRGICGSLHSDCGTNFVGADAALWKLFTSGTREFKELSHLLSGDGTLWFFSPPAAPHFGGKWEAAVKSVKHHLRRTIGDALLTFEELTTLLLQIEAVLNSRPLHPLSDDPDDLDALTPGHFLIGAALTAVPEPSLSTVPVARLSRWQLIQQKFQYFWARWAKECLQRHLAISKWHHPTNEIRENSLVLITDERFPPAKWPLARVLSLHPGADGLTRVITLKTSSGTLVRPIAKLSVVPISTPTD